MGKHRTHKMSASLPNSKHGIIQTLYIHKLWHHTHTQITELTSANSYLDSDTHMHTHTHTHTRTERVGQKRRNIEIWCLIERRYLKLYDWQSNIGFNFEHKFVFSFLLSLSYNCSIHPYILQSFILSQEFMSQLEISEYMCFSL